MSLCALITAVINYNKSLEKLQDFFLETKTKTFIFVLEAPADQDPGLEDYITAWQDRFYNTKYARPRSWYGVQDETNFWSQTGIVLRPTISGITGIGYMSVHNDVSASHCKEIIVSTWL